MVKKKKEENFTEHGEEKTFQRRQTCTIILLMNKLKGRKTTCGIENHNVRME